MHREWASQFLQISLLFFNHFFVISIKFLYRKAEHFCIFRVYRADVFLSSYSGKALGKFHFFHFPCTRFLRKSIKSDGNRDFWFWHVLPMLKLYKSAFQNIDRILRINLCNFTIHATRCALHFLFCCLFANFKPWRKCSCISFMKCVRLFGSCHQ